jgi:undecaprenyl-diphosphatase
VTVLDQTGRTGPLLKETLRRLPRKVLLPGLAIYALIVGIGLLLTQVFTSVSKSEDGLDRSFAANRTGGWNTATEIFSLLGSTPVIIGLMLVTGVALRLAFHRWRESIIVITAVTLQATIFLFTGFVIDRQRPDVAKLEEAAPTSSFPSGHTGAATALYLAIALILAWQLRRTAWKPILIGLLVLLPLAVGVSRLYRGMHHPTDVIVGIANGIACIFVAARAYLTDWRERLHLN